MTQEEINQQSKEIFYTLKINNIFIGLIPDDREFSQEKYREVLIEAYKLYKAEQITFEELVSVGSRLQIRQLPKRSLGAFKKYNLFSILEQCNSLEYAYFHNPEYFKTLKPALLESLEVLARPLTEESMHPN